MDCLQQYLVCSTHLVNVHVIIIVVAITFVVTTNLPTVTFKKFFSVPLIALCVMGPIS